MLSLQNMECNAMKISKNAAKMVLLKRFFDHILSMSAIFFLVFHMGNSAKAYALFDIQGSIGGKSSRLSDDVVQRDLKGYSLMGRFHVDPIPMWPISFGLTAAWSDLAGDEPVAKSLKGYDLGVETEAWIPISRLEVFPFVRLGWTYFGDYKIKADSGQSRLQPEGFFYALGFKWYVLFKAAISIEYLDERRVFYRDGGSLSEHARSFLIGGQSGI
jgi:hypothetical protein